MSRTIFETLREDHDQQRQLLDLVEITSGDSERRREVFDLLKQELLDHAAAEERVFYAELLSHEITRDMSGHSVKEHHEMEKIVEELDAMDMSSPGWLLRFKTLAHKVRHHLEEEERQIFQLAGKALSEGLKTDLATRFRDQKPLTELPVESH
jgi:hemerythrin HHE cation binding domain-containing protein